MDKSDPFSETLAYNEHDIIIFPQNDPFESRPRQGCHATHDAMLDSTAPDLFIFTTQ